MTAQLATLLCGGLGGTSCSPKVFGLAEVDKPDAGVTPALRTPFVLIPQSYALKKTEKLYANIVTKYAYAVNVKNPWIGIGAMVPSSVYNRTRTLR